MAPDLTGQKVFGAFNGAYLPDTHTSTPGTKCPSTYSTYGYYADPACLPDYVGHGTEVAATAAARANDGIGIAGVCPGCFVTPIQITRGEPISEWAIYMGLCAAQNKGPKVTCMSLGPDGFSYYESDFVKHAIEDYCDNAAWETNNRGGLLFVSAGENQVGGRGVVDENILDDRLILVGATDPSGNIASFSNFGGAIQFYMPGQEILTWTKEGLKYRSGTSQAAPMAAAAAAMVWWANPNLTRSQVLAILRQTASNKGQFSAPTVGSDGKMNALHTGYGVINVGNAVGAAR